MLGRREQCAVDLHEAALETALFARVIAAHDPETFDILRIDRIKRCEPIRGQGTAERRPVSLGGAAGERETGECERGYRKNRIG